MASSGKGEAAIRRLLDGDAASGAWYPTALTVIELHYQAIWAMSICRDEFRRIEGNWKIASLNVEFKHHTMFEDRLLTRQSVWG